MRKTITINTHYIPLEWGIRDEASKVGGLTAFVRYVRSDDPSEYYKYGDDADTYKAFEEEGFIKTKTFTNYADCYKWLKENAEDSIRG